MTVKQLTDPIQGYSQPDRYWATTNVAEATPDILSPLCWSIWGDGLEHAWLQSMHEFGVLSRQETAMSEDMNDRSTAVFYGRQAANVDVLRRVLAKLPGVDPNDVERDLLGSVRPGLHKEPGNPKRVPIVMSKLPIALWRLDGRVRRLHRDHCAWWRSEVFDALKVPTSAPQALSLLHDAAVRFSDAMTLHSMVRFLLPAAEKVVRGAAESVGVPHLATAALQGYGQVTETQMADDLWRVAQGELTLPDFLGTYGFHGPNTGNVYTRSWREQPERVEALVASYVKRSDAARPSAMEASSVIARAAAEKELMRRLSHTKRPFVSWFLRRHASLIRKLELGKASYLMALDGARGAARLLGGFLVDDGRLSEVDDTFFLTVSELASMVEDAQVDLNELIAFRRDKRQQYASIELPVRFTGVPDPISTAVRDSDEIWGAASGGGVVRGRARVVTRAGDDVNLDEGDVLVCRFTDPSWVPLMVLASALVIDIGSQQSRGAVVARELGVPYVIGTGTGSSVLRDGDVLEVDGESCVVRVLERSPQEA